jgi:hypothetical protein
MRVLHILLLLFALAFAGHAASEDLGVRGQVYGPGQDAREAIKDAVRKKNG